MRVILALSLVCAALCATIMDFDKTNMMDGSTLAAIQAEAAIRADMDMDILGFDFPSTECVASALKVGKIALSSCGNVWAEIGKMYVGIVGKSTVDGICSGSCLTSIIESLEDFGTECGLNSRYQETIGQFKQLTEFLCVKNEHNEYCVTSVSVKDIPTSACDGLKIFTDSNGCCTYEMIHVATSVMSESGASNYMDTIKGYFERCAVPFPSSCIIPAEKAAKMDTKLKFSLPDSISDVAAIANAICQDFRMKTKLRAKGQIACKVVSVVAGADGVSGDATSTQTVVIDATALGDASGSAGLNDVKAGLDSTDWTTEEWATASAAAGVTVKADSVEPASPDSARGVMVGMLAMVAVLVMLL